MSTLTKQRFSELVDSCELTNLFTRLGMARGYWLGGLKKRCKHSLNVIRRLDKNY
jgi:hypothetical protein